MGSKERTSRGNGPDSLDTRNTPAAHDHRPETAFHRITKDDFYAKNGAAISKILDACFTITPPFVAHGLRHHVRTAGTVLEIGDAAQLTEELRDRDALLVAALLHDVFRVHDIEGSTGRIEILQSIIGSSFGSAFAETAIELIRAHNEIGHVDTVEKAILFIADKIDYSFERGFLVQLYDKFIVKKTSGPASTAERKKEQILTELTAKKKSDLAAVDTIAQRFTAIPSRFIDAVIAIHESTDATARELILAHGVEIDRYKVMLRKIIVEDIQAELQLKGLLGLAVPERRLLQCQLDFVRSQASFLKRIVVALLSYAGRVDVLAKQ